MFCYVGGKHSIANKLIQYYPEHKIYVEPFGGMATMFFYKEPSEKEVYNDINKNAVNLFRVLRDEEKTNKLIRMFEYFVSSVDFVEEAYKNYNNPQVDEITRAYYFVYILQNSRGLINKFSALNGVRNTETSKELIIEKIKAVHRRFEKVVIENVDWEDCFRRYDSKETFFYCDPPYLTKDIDKIYHNSMSTIEHKKLLHKIKECQGMVIISGYDHPLYQYELEEHGWKKAQFKTKLKFSRLKKIERERIETIWIKPNCINKTNQLTIDTLEELDTE